MDSDSRLLVPPSSNPSPSADSPNNLSPSSDSLNNPLPSSDSPPLRNPETNHSSSSDPNSSPESNYSSSNLPPIPRPYCPTQPLYYGGAPPYLGPPQPYHPGLPVHYCPPPPPVYPSYHDPNEHNCNTINCLCRTVLILIVLSILSFVMSLFLKPTHNVTELPSISLTQASVNSFAIAPSPSYITPDFNLTFSLINPSKESSLNYNLFDVGVAYGDTIVAGWNTQRPLNQEKSTETNKTARAITVDVSLGEPTVEKMKDEIKRNGGLVEFEGRVRILLSAGKTTWGAGRWTSAFCPGIKVEVKDGMTTGNVVGIPISCSLR